MNKANILVVDDELIERQTLTDILRLEGHHVMSVPNGEAAVDYVRLNPVDLMVLDLRMPGMNGLDVIKVVNRISPDIEIILLTAHGSIESAIDALRSQVHDYLLKPSSPNQIIDSVTRGLSRRSAKIAEREHQQAEASSDENAVVILGDGTVVDYGRRLVRSETRTINLTPAEGRLLRIFVENIGKVFTHRELVLLVQGYSTTQQEAPEILRPLVSRLRQKLAGIPSLMKRIVSVRGTGYVFEDSRNPESVKEKMNDPGCYSCGPIGRSAETSGGRSQLSSPRIRLFSGWIFSKPIISRLKPRKDAPIHWTELRFSCNQKWLIVIETINSLNPIKAV